MVTSPSIALQLYSVRNELAGDLPGTLAAVRAAGYQQVEWFGGLWGLSAKELRCRLDDVGLRLIAAHVDFGTLLTDPVAMMDTYEELGCCRIVCPWLSEQQRGDGSRQIYRHIGQQLDGIGYRLKARGFHLGYHNHDFELERPGVDGIQEILSWASHPNFFVELDLFWLAFAGRDPAAYLREVGSRVGLVHVKDGGLDPGVAEPDRFVPLGQGVVDLDAALEAALELEVQGLIVEQDFSRSSPLDDAHVSFEYLRDWLDRRGAAT